MKRIFIGNNARTLLFIFVVVLAVRLLITFQTPSFSTSESYFTLRQVENIKENGLPIYNDAISYSGRQLIFLPFFYYLVSMLTFFLPTIAAAKILVNIISACTIFPVYLITKKLTSDRKVALFTAFASGFIPLYFSLTINSISPTVLFVPLMLLFIYFFMDLEKKKSLYFLILAFFVILISSTSVIIIVIGMLLYMLLAKLEHLNQRREEAEVILFLTFVTFWLMFLLFKDVFLFHGISFIWRNIPDTLLNKFFVSLNVAELIVKIGIIPFIYGLYIIYKYVFRSKDKNIYLLISFTLSILIMIWLKLLEFNLGVILLSILLTIMFGRGFKLTLNYLARTKFSKYENLVILLLFFIFLFNSVWPAFTYSIDEVGNSFTPAEIEAYKWLQSNTNNQSIVIASTAEGHLITYYGKRKNVIDSNFILVPNINQRYEDIDQLYRAFSLTEAINLITKYKANYILVSPRAKEEFNTTELKYVEDPCFNLTYNNQIKIYQSLCEIK